MASEVTNADKESDAVMNTEERKDTTDGEEENKELFSLESILLIV